MAACSIDLITNTEVSGTTSTLIGSARIISGSNTTVSFRTMLGTDIAGTASLEMKRFTGGASIIELTASGTGLQDVSGSGQSVSDLGLVNDWYDFYLSGSSGATTAIIKGIKVTLY